MVLRSSTFRLRARVFVGSLLVAGCSAEPPRGWTPLWQGAWDLYQVDADSWLRGVALDEERTFSVDGAASVRFRALLANRDDVPREVTLAGPSGVERWILPPGGERAVESVVEPGVYRLEGAPGVVAGQPRLGLPLEHPRLLIVLLADTLRDDHVEPDLTPGILEAFAGGARWTDVTANSPWTLPSVASLFTSRPVLDLSLPDGGLIGVPRGVPTWSERLAEAGFAGGAAVANYTVHAQNGFARGFSSYRVPGAGGGADPPDASWVVEEGRRFLAAHRGEDAFLYLHFMDPHEPFRDHGAGLAEPPTMAVLGHRRRAATPEEQELLRTLYRGEVRHLDRVLTPFLEELPEDATVAFVSDHGEALGEHGVWGHGLALYQEVVAVPLLLRGPRVATGTIDRPTQLLDLAPTLLESMAVPPAGGMAGASLLEARLSTRRQQPILTATFAAGPLRWAWRDARSKVVLRTAPQTEGAPGGRRVREDDPLAAGAFVHRIPGAEDRSGPVSPDLALRVARLFARSAGSMVAGITLLVAGVEGPAEVVFDASGPLEPVHVWGTGEVQVERQGDRWTVRTAGAYPLAGVAFRAEGEVEITPVGGSLPWPAGSSASRSARRPGPPRMEGPGLYLWWNEERAVEISGQEETEQRLRALGYL